MVCTNDVVPTRTDQQAVSSNRFLHLVKHSVQVRAGYFEVPGTLSENAGRGVRGHGYLSLRRDGAGFSICHALHQRFQEFYPFKHVCIWSEWI
jgi:hypothetical protein